jgi:hypothetical protein
MTVGSFNRACRAVAAAWLIGLAATSLWLRPTYQDFSAFYLAGVLARNGAWQDLYPLMAGDNPYYIGEIVKMKPGYEQAARRRNVKDLCVFLQPPWTAIAFVPLSILPFRAAHALWIALMTACTIGVSWYAGRSFALCADRPSRWEGVTCLIFAMSLLACRGIRVGNTSPLVAWCIGFGAVDLLRRDRASSAAALWIGGIMKYATAMLVPVAIMLRRWRSLAALVLLGILTMGASISIAGRAAFAEFFDPVAASIPRSSPNPGNQSLQAFLLRIRHIKQLSPAARLLLHAAQLALLLLILVLMFRQRRGQSPPIVFASAAALLCWLLIFAPLFWDHYHLYLAPFWGWMIFEARRSIPRAVLVTAAIALAWAPLMVVRSIHLPEPVNSAMLFSAILMLILALDRLARRLPVSDHPSPQC